MAKGRNAMAIWQDLVDGHGFAGRYASVKRFVRKTASVNTHTSDLLASGVSLPAVSARLGHGDRRDQFLVA